MNRWTLRGPRRGDWVEVRSAAEILATLDAQGTVGGMPFMPEMLPYIGRRYRIAASAHKTCDTVHKRGIRRVERAVHLEGLNCDGGGHGGCQAACLLFWRQEWLRPVRGPGQGAAGPVITDGSDELASRLAAWSLRPDPPAGATDGPYYRCQATDLPKFVHAASPLDPRLYARDLWSGNVSPLRALRVLAIAMFNAIQRRRSGVGYPRMYRPSWLTRTPSETLNLQPGEVVRIKSKEAILATLDATLKNRGLSFDPEMTSFCERQVKVAARVERILDERSGRMLTMPRDSIRLEGVVCRGDYSQFRLLCPRAIPPFWREIWLERVSDPAKADS